MNFGQALIALKDGHKVTCDRWPDTVVVELVTIEKGEYPLCDVEVFILHDYARNKSIIFTPSVENIIDDEWQLINKEELK